MKSDKFPSDINWWAFKSCILKFEEYSKKVLVAWNVQKEKPVKVNDLYRSVTDSINPYGESI